MGWSLVGWCWRTWWWRGKDAGMGFREVVVVGKAEGPSQGIEERRDGRGTMARISEATKGRRKIGDVKGVVGHLLCVGEVSEEGSGDGVQAWGEEVLPNGGGGWGVGAVAKKKEYIGAEQVGYFGKDAGAEENGFRL